MALSESICVQAKLTLRSTADGGRETGIKTCYRPNHVFEYRDGQIVSYIGEILFDKDKIIMPGDTADVTVCFLKIPEVQPYLTLGRQWFIHEGPKLLGQAVITKLLDVDCRQVDSVV